MYKRRYSNFVIALLVILPVILSAPVTSGATITAKSAPNGQTLFPEKQFDLQCWQEGIRIIDEKSLRTMTVAPELNNKLISFKQGKQGDKSENEVIVVTLGRALCLAKTR